jgi:eukaryotic-like serine/threonine-protein kinase
MAPDRMDSDPFGIVGRIIDGRYRVQCAAGQGGFGVVYRAQHLGFESPIALKVLKLPETWSLQRKQTRIASFQREGRVLFELSALHPAIVRAFETGTIAGPDGSPAPYLALEWLEGVSLDHESKLRREQGLAPMTLPEVLGLLHGSAEGLARAHRRGIAHRDVKPGNLFVSMRSGEPYVKILDFGIAKMIDASADTTAQYAATPGSTASFTAMYAAPEQWLERLGATGPWTDVHAFALVCVELLSGSIPFAGRESAQFMAACLDPTLRPTPKSRGVELATQVEAVFAKAVALEPRARFRDMGAFWRELCEAAHWSPEHPGTGVVLASALVKTTISTDPAVVRDVNDRADALQLSSARTTTATATLAGLRVAHAVRSSRSPWLLRALIAMAVTSFVGYLVTNVDGTRTNVGEAPAVPHRPDSRHAAPDAPQARRTASAHGVASSFAAPERSRGSISVAPTRRRFHRASDTSDAAATLVDPQSTATLDAAAAKHAPSPVASAPSADSPATPATPSDEPKPHINYDDPALTRRR